MAENLSGPFRVIELDEGVNPDDFDGHQDELTWAEEEALKDCLCPDDVRQAKQANTLIEESLICDSCLARDVLNHLSRVAKA